MNICVVGMGKIGLPLAVHYAEQNNLVTGLDTNTQTVITINSGDVPFPGEKDLAEKLYKVVQLKKLFCTTDYSYAIPNAKIILVIVPLFVNGQGEPDFSVIDSVTNEIGKLMNKGTQVIYETTLPIGTTRNRFTKSLENLSEMKEGQDFYVAFSPERVLTGRVFEDLGKYPKIVGGVSPVSSKAAADFYSENINFIEREDLQKPNGVWQVGNSEAAEFVKLAETTYRDVNIGLANQFAKFAHKIELDIYEIIAAANSQTFSHIHQPGISVGGHCIPIYPQLYLWSDQHATIVEEARKSNLEMPEYAVALIKKITPNLSGLSVGILGITYRPGVKETAFSGAFALRDILESEDAKVFVDDPMYSKVETEEKNLRPISDKSKIEILILHTSHDCFDENYFKDFSNLKIVLDGRNTLNSKWLKSGVALIKLGNGIQQSST